MVDNHEQYEKHRKVLYTHSPHLNGYSQTQNVTPHITSITNEQAWTGKISTSFPASLKGGREDRPWERGW